MRYLILKTLDRLPFLERFCHVVRNAKISEVTVAFVICVMRRKNRIRYSGEEVSRKHTAGIAAPLWGKNIACKPEALVKVAGKVSGDWIY